MFLENTVNPKEQFGWIEVICGSMFSGKTEELIRRLKRAKFAKQKVEIFKPMVDKRYHEEMVVSHDANEIRSTPVPAAANIRLLADDCDVVGIDEAQFFDDEIVTVCNDLANKGIRVVVAGLDMDFKGNPFGPMPALMATAEYVTKVHAVCTRTGNLANYSFRKANNNKLVFLGETEEYEPLSRAAYYKAMLKEKVSAIEVTSEEVLPPQKNRMTKVGETVLEIDLRALEHNYLYLRSKIDPETKFLGVVKAFAYGSDSIAIAKKLESLGADYLAVAYTSEGVALRNAGIKLPILVLHPQEVSFATMIEKCLEPSLYSRTILSSFVKMAKDLGQMDYPVHLKFNTGLNRLGLGEKDIDFILTSLEGAEQIKISSLFSHLAASEDLNEKDFTISQIRQFEKISSALISKIKYSPKRHMLNTSGIINYPEAQYDMVRSGIGLYGYGNEAAEDEKLIPVATLKTIISQIHRIEPNESVGYNRAFVSNTSKVTATLPIGHADGIGRQYGNRVGQVSVHGKLAPIIGNVCMDMIMVDITGIDCKEGDEVIVFGQEHSAEDLASSAQTITYELLTGISQRVKRVYMD